MDWCDIPLWQKILRGMFILNKDHPVWPESEERIDIVGSNGNTGEHYIPCGSKTDKET